MILIPKVLEKIFNDYKSMSESDCWWLSIMTDHSKTGTISTFVNLLLINKKKEGFTEAKKNRKYSYEN